MQVIRILCLLLLSASATAQTLLPEISRSLTSHRTSYALILTHDNDYGSLIGGGVVLNQFAGKVKPGAKIHIQVPLFPALAVYTQADAFLQRNTSFDANFLELQGGLIFTHNWAYIGVGYKLDEYTDKRYRDCIVLKLGGVIKWAR